ncbi:MAG: hypothetical protein WBA89_08945, partial [Microcoleus sp.]
LKSAEALRNKLAHAQDLINGSSWPEVILLAQEIEALLQRCEEFEIATPTELQYRTVETASIQTKPASAG